MINNSVSKAYENINSMVSQVEKAEKGELPKEPMAKESSDKKGLLIRNKGFENRDKIMSEEDDVEVRQQKLVIAYILSIRNAFKEVKSARANSKS